MKTKEEEETMLIRSAVAVIRTLLSICLLAACGEEMDLAPLTSAMESLICIRVPPMKGWESMRRRLCGPGEPTHAWKRQSFV